MESNFVTFIGAGNLAWHLAPALDNAGYPVREIFSRHEKNAKALAGRLYQCEVVTDLNLGQSASRIFILAVPDDALTEVLPALILPEGAVIVHTSGSQPLSILEEPFSSSRTGVFYPLQTFSRIRKVQFENIPICVESMDKQTSAVLMSMASAISRRVVPISSQNRFALHVAAVFASNFTNHMLTIAEHVMQKEDLDYELLKPLIAETLNKSLEVGPTAAQTGPARRGDLEILDRHMEFLNDEPEVAEIYKNVSQHIIDTY